MAQLTIDELGATILREGRPHPLVIDTSWSAFADAAPAEWGYYLRTRRQQGFTAAAVSILPILHDRTVRDDAREPFSLDDEGHYRFDQPDPGYFRTAHEFTRMAAKEGLTLALVVLWNNYVEGTWGAELTPWAVMDAHERRSYVALVARTFAEFDPVFVVSGDDRFGDRRAIGTYGDVLAQLSCEAPNCLTTMHSTPDADLPEELANSADLDFYVYQSGHDMDRQDRCVDLAGLYRGKPVRKPVINLEPAYEQHGYGGGSGRFRAADIRRASWSSILAGASAGIGYGAHGVWQWHRAEGSFTNPEFSLEPFPWQSALHFRGADDISLISYLLRTHDLYRLGARQDLLKSDTGGVRVATSEQEDLIAVYEPSVREVTLRQDLSRYRLQAWDLECRTPVTARIDVEDGQTVIHQPDVTGDVIVLFERA